MQKCIRGLQTRTLALCFIALIGCTLTAQTNDPLASALSNAFVVEREIRIPMQEAAPDGLAGLLVLPKLPGKHPLLLLTHGDYEARFRREMGPGELLPEALWFARRGWDVAIVLRRGFGLSGGKPIEDALPHMLASEHTWDYMQGSNARDLQVAYRYLTTRPDVDVSTTVVAGFFTGGSAAMWMADDPPPGLKAVINFSGGWATLPDWVLKGKIHVTPDVIVPAFTKLAQHTKVPMLWLYPKSGSLFGLKSAIAAHDAFVAAGGHAEMVVLPHQGDHDRFLFGENPAEWGDRVESFLSGLGLPSVAVIAEPPPDKTQLTRMFKGSAVEGYLRYSQRGLNKAFAYSPAGAWGFANGRSSLKNAEEEALQNCGHTDCKVIDTVSLEK